MFWNKAYYFVLILCYGTGFGNAEETTSKNTLTDSELKEHCQGLEFKFVAHPSNQQNYIICVPGGGVEKSCATSECYDERNPPCSTTCNANTYVADQKTKDYCNDDDTPLLERVADDKDCESYYLCVGKNIDPLAQKCPPNQHFSVEHNTCMNYHEANCAASSKWCKKRKDNTRFPKDKCYEYYECENEMTLTKSCEYNEHFDSELGKCASGMCEDDKRVPDCKDKHDGVRVAHAKCYKYFVCFNQSLFEAQCASGYRFDAERSVCVRDVNDVCNDI